MTDLPLWFLVPVLFLAGCGKNDSHSASAPEAASAPAAVVRAEDEDLALNIPVSDRFDGAVQARVSEKYVTVIYADGNRVIAPLSSLNATDLRWLRELAEAKPFTGRATVTVAKAETLVQRKETIAVAKTEDGLETVQLVSPAIFRDQIGATCMIYARVHWLDIAGYYVERGDLYKIINNTPPNEPWLEPRYVAGLTGIEAGFSSVPISHRMPLGIDAFAWAREELRKGRPILAAFPEAIWRALPPGFMATRPWAGGGVGHQIVVNGFTWNRTTGEGSFHIVNTWKELPEFDIDLAELQRGELVFERSLSPVGEPVEAQSPALGEL